MESEHTVISVICKCKHTHAYKTHTHRETTQHVSTVASRSLTTNYRGEKKVPYFFHIVDIHSINGYSVAIVLYRCIDMNLICGFACYWHYI